VYFINILSPKLTKSPVLSGISKLAVKMGIARSTISKIENGEFAFSVDYLIKLSENLDFILKLDSHVP